MKYFGILYTEVNLISFALEVVLLIQIYRMRQRRGYRFLIISISAMLAVIVSDNLAVLMANHVLAAPDRMVILFKTIYFLSASYMSYFLMLHFEDRAGTIIGTSLKRQLQLSFFAALHFVLLLLNLKYGFFFYMASDGMYTRGSLFALQFVFSYLYFATAILRAGYYAIFKTNYIDRSYVLTLILFTAFPAMAGIIQLFVRNVPVLCACLAFSTFLLYLNDMEGMIYNDPLTGVYNRRRGLQIISQKMHVFHGKGGLYLLMVDIDLFKKINDEYGHIAGDQILCMVADVLDKSGKELQNSPMVCRYGGDEFVVLLEAEQETQVQVYMQGVEEAFLKAQEKVQLPYRCTLSIGYVEYNDTMRMVNDFVASADKDMYEMKDPHHHKRGM